MNGEMKNKEIQENLDKLEKKIEVFEGKIIKLIKTYNIVDFLL
jgi:tetrahydromethanopterin S-methyltransferase subunit G